MPPSGAPGAAFQIKETYSHLYASNAYPSATAWSIAARGTHPFTGEYGSIDPMPEW